MADLKRKLIALFFMLVFLAATAAISGCKGDSGAEKSTPKKQKLPDDMQ
jgi:hypothetical protein